MPALPGLTPQEAKLIQSLMKGADMVMPVDCADRRVQFTVHGWFVFPKGSLTKPHDVMAPS